ncbi:FAD-binding oxidoreductase [Candidatus Magnetomoraceae bacterium gMMP-15]
MNNNILVPKFHNIDRLECSFVKGSKDILENYASILADESRMKYQQVPERIYFPKTTDEVAAAIRDIRSRNENVTLSGARTGLVGGAVPFQCNNLLSLEKLSFTPTVYFNNELKSWIIRVGAGTRLKELHTYLKKKNYAAEIKPPSGLFYPVDPTETTASIGGNVATNASGARTLYYGPTRDWVAGLTIVLGNGGVLKLRRGEKYAKAGKLFLQMPDGSLSEILIPDIKIPCTKHVAGYYIKNNMDAIDLFIGGEGTLGIITEVELKLCKPHENNFYIIVFLTNKCNYINLVENIKSSEIITLIALEYMDDRSVKLLKKYREKQGSSSGVPFIPDKTTGVLYIEAGFEKKNKEIILEELNNLFIKYNILEGYTWVASTQAGLNKMKKFRHALPEQINSIIAERKIKIPELTKISTDMAVPNSCLKKIIDIYKSTLDSQELEYYIFGHIGNSHLHVNIIPDSIEELKSAWNVYKKFAEKVVEFQGSVAAEHGIGKLKKDFLKIQFSEKEINNMRLLKQQFDPDNILNPGVLF